VAAKLGFEAVLEAALDLVAASQDPADVMDQLVRHATWVANADRGTIARVEGDEVVIEAAYNPRGRGLRRGSRWKISEQPELAATIAGGRSRRMTALNVEAIPSDLQHEYDNLRHVLSVPFGSEGRVEGLLALIRNREPDFTQEEQEAVERLAKIAALSLRNAQLLRDARSTSKRLGIALEAAEEIASQVEVRAALVRLVERAAELAGAQTATLTHLQEGRLIIDHSTAMAEVPTGSVWPMVPTLERALELRRPMIVPPSELAAANPEMAERITEELQTVVLPLLHRDEVVGILGLSRFGSPFTNEEVGVLDEYAPLAAILLRNATLLQEARRRELDLLLQTSHIVGAALDLDTVVSEVLKAAAAIVSRPGTMQGRRASLLQVKDDRLILFAEYDERGAILSPGANVPLSQAPPAMLRTIRTGRADVQRVAEMRGPVRQIAAQTGATAYAYAAVHMDGELFGVLSAAAHEGQTFEAAELALLEGLAAIAGLGIANAQRHRAVVSLQQRLQAGVDTALELGSSLDLNQVISRLLERTLALTDADRVTLSSIEGDRITIQASVDRAGGTTSRWAGLSYPIEAARAQPTVYQALTARKPVVGGQLNVAEAAPELKEALGEVHSTVVLPLLLGQQLVAMLVVSRRAERPFQEDEVSTLQQMGSIAVLALNNARLFDQVQEASASKSAFLNMAAHELRTPLSVIQGYLALMEDGSLPLPNSARLGPIKILSQKATELSSMVDDLLVSARLQSGALKLDRKPLEMGPAVDEAIGRAAPRVSLLEAEVTFAEGEKAVALVDPDSFGRIMDNLLNNALTYSDKPARIKVSISDGDTVGVRVQDNGRGIAREQWDRIFEPFYRVADRSERLPGAGLGLAISRDLAVKNGGRLIVEQSELGKGTTFLLSLPRA
jgi:signal transduction histidine kinase